MEWQGVAWLDGSSPNQYMQKSAFSIDVDDDGGGNYCAARCSCCCKFGTSAGVEGDREKDLLLQNDLIDDNELKLKWLTLLSRHPVFLRWLSFLS